MYPVTISKNLAFSFEKYFCNSSSNASIVFFDGPVPNSVEDVPMDWQTNFTNMMRNSLASAELGVASINRSPDDHSLRYLSTVVQSCVKTHKFFPGFNRWVLNHRYIGLERSHLGVQNWQGDPNSDYTGEVDRHEQTSFNVGEIQDSLRHEAFRYNNRNTWLEKFDYDSGLEYAPSRYPMVIDYGYDVTVDSILFAHGDAYSYRISDYVDIDYWDTETQTWQPAERAEFTTNTMGSQKIDFGTQYTASKFRLTFADTDHSGYPFFLKFVHLCSTIIPPQDTTPVDITWAALVINQRGFRKGIDFNTFETQETSGALHGYPFLFMDVGEPGDDAAVTLAKSKQVEGFEELSVLDLELNFRE